MSERSAYAAAGVDIEAGDRAVELMKKWVAKTRRPEVMGDIGGFAGLFDASALAHYEHPVLATSTDGVGTKVAIAQALDRHDTIGFDLVGMVVDDLVVCGAEPLFMTDYIACGKVDPERIAAIVKGIAIACSEAGCALLGGETAEHPGLLGPDEYDLAGAATGVVERDQILGAERVVAGDVLLAMESSGPALQRLLPGQARIPQLRLGAGSLRFRARPDPWRGTADPDSDLRSRLPRGDRSRRGACDEPYHRWWTGEQSCPCHSCLMRSANRPYDLAAAACLRTHSAARRDLRARPRGDVQYGRRDGRGAAAPTWSTKPYTCLLGVGCGPGCADRLCPTQATPSG